MIEPVKNWHDLHEIERYLRSRFDYRYYMIWQLGKHTLLRASDVLPLKYRQIFNDDGAVRPYIFTKDRKTRKFNTLYLSGVKDDLIRYQYWLKHHGINSVYLFPTVHNSSNQYGKCQKGYISRQSFYRAVKITGSDLNIKHLGTHSMRKTGAYLTYKQTGNLALVMKLLNHSSEAMTLRYLGLPNKLVSKTLADVKMD